MGLPQDGRWVDKWYDTKSSGGRFVRKTSKFRKWITADSAPGPPGQGGFKADAGRYYLHASLACPWAHRTSIFRAIIGLEDTIGVSIVHWFMGKDGWPPAAARR